MLNEFTASLQKEGEKGTEILPSWFRQQPAITLDPEVIHNAERINEYRNKVEFTIGYRYSLEKQSEDGICVGFNVGDSSKGINYVAEAGEIRVNSQNSLRCAQLMTSLVEESGLKPYQKAMQTGFWRILLYRESQKTG